MLAVNSAPAQDEAPTPYNFAFEEQDANYTIARQEEMDAQGTVRGSYSYLDKDGFFRRVNYVADENGFQATIDSNEPGLKSGETAGAIYNIQ